MDFRADLHCHTSCSDGSMSPEEVVRHAIEVGLAGLSITDHDTVDAYPLAIPIARELGLALGTGVEFSSIYEGKSVHILGYDFKLDHPQIQAFCQMHLERRRSRSQKILEKLARQGISLNLDELEISMGEGHPIGRPHIALALLQKGIVTSIQDAFNRYLGDGRPCYDPGEPITCDETIDVIHEAGGKAFLAHPHLMKDSNFIDRLLQKSFDGIECYYSKCNPQQEKRWVKVAMKRNLLISGGSDFHGVIKPGIPLGCSWVNREIFDQIFQNNRCF